MMPATLLQTSAPLAPVPASPPKAVLLQNRTGKVFVSLEGALPAPPLCAIYYKELDIFALLLADRRLMPLGQDVYHEFSCALERQETICLFPLDRGLKKISVPLVIRQAPAR